MSTLLAVAFTIGLTTASPVAGGIAHFWLSTSNTAPPGPEAPTVNLSPGGSDILYLWARPATDKKLRNVSLNLVADASGVDFDDSRYTMFNTLTSGVTRFQFLHDAFSSPALMSTKTAGEVAAGSIDELNGLQGFTITGADDIRGIGAECVDGETGCFAATDGSPAWLMADIKINAVTAGTINLYLQMGDVGMNHETVAKGDYNYDGAVDTSDFSFWIDAFGSAGSTLAASADSNNDGMIDAIDYANWREGLGKVGVIESASLTDAVFGFDTSADTEPLHNAVTDRSINLTFDDPDAVIVIAAPGQGAETVPEPTAATLLAVWFIGFSLRKRR